MAVIELPEVPPVLAVDLSGSAELTGRSSRYEKRLRDLDGVYQDADAFSTACSATPDALAYWVDESRAGEQAGALIVGMSTLLPGVIGNEFAMTRGHLHAKTDCAEFYYGVAGRGLLVMDDLHGRTAVAELTPGTGVHVPGGWIHRSVNVGAEPFVTVFAYDAAAGQDYEIIRDAGGMRELIVRDGESWARRANTRHSGYGLRAGNS